MKLSLKDIFNTIHAHPTLPESFVDAIRDINNQAIHLPSSKKENQIRKLVDP
jgi:hypothetical protein